MPKVSTSSAFLSGLNRKKNSKYVCIHAGDQVIERLRITSIVPLAKFLGGNMEPDKCRETGRKDAKLFISREQIDYEPFVALSDMHLVRKTIPVSFATLKKTITKLDSELWQEIADSVAELEKKHGESFSSDHYAEGFVEGIAAVWDEIRDEVLSRPSHEM